MCYLVILIPPSHSSLSVFWFYRLHGNFGKSRSQIQLNSENFWLTSVFNLTWSKYITSFGSLFYKYEFWNILVTFLLLKLLSKLWNFWNFHVWNFWLCSFFQSSKSSVWQCSSELHVKISASLEGYNYLLALHWKAIIKYVCVYGRPIFCGCIR